MHLTQGLFKEKKQLFMPICNMQAGGLYPQYYSANLCSKAVISRRLTFRTYQPVALYYMQFYLKL